MHHRRGWTLRRRGGGRRPLGSEGIWWRRRIVRVRKSRMRRARVPGVRKTGLTENNKENQSRRLEANKKLTRSTAGLHEKRRMDDRPAVGEMTGTSSTTKSSASLNIAACTSVLSGSGVASSAAGSSKTVGEGESAGVQGVVNVLLDVVRGWHQFKYDHDLLWSLMDSCERGRAQAPWRIGPTFVANGTGRPDGSCGREVIRSRYRHGDRPRV
jgi:hypothetical protein